MIPSKENTGMTSSTEPIVRNLQAPAQEGASVGFSAKDFPNGQRFEHGGIVPKDTPPVTRWIVTCTWNDLNSSVCSEADKGRKETVHLIRKNAESHFKRERRIFLRRAKELGYGRIHEAHVNNRFTFKMMKDGTLGTFTQYGPTVEDVIETKQLPPPEPGFLEYILRRMQWPIVVSSAIHGAVIPWDVALHWSDMDDWEVFACTVGLVLLTGFSIVIAWMRGLLEGKPR